MQNVCPTYIHTYIHTYAKRLNKKAVLTLQKLSLDAAKFSFRRSKISVYTQENFHIDAAKFSYRRKKTFVYTQQNLTPSPFKAPLNPPEGGKQTRRSIFPSFGGVRGDFFSPRLWRGVGGEVQPKPSFPRRRESLSKKNGRDSRLRGNDGGKSGNDGERSGNDSEKTGITYNRINFKL